MCSEIGSCGLSTDAEFSGLDIESEIESEIGSEEVSAGVAGIDSSTASDVDSEVSGVSGMGAMSRAVKAAFSASVSAFQTFWRSAAPAPQTSLRTPWIFLANSGSPASSTVRIYSSSSASSTCC